jgi:hypothetical protein
MPLVRWGYKGRSVLLAQLDQGLFNGLSQLCFEWTSGWVEKAVSMSSCQSQEGCCEVFLRHTGSVETMVFCTQSLHLAVGGEPWYCE